MKVIGPLVNRSKKADLMYLEMENLEFKHRVFRDKESSKSDLKFAIWRSLHVTALKPRARSVYTGNGINSVREWIV